MSIEVGHGQLQVVLLFEPALGVFVLALGAVPIAARVIAIERLAAVGAGVDMPTQGGGAAVLDGPHRLEVAGRQSWRRTWRDRPGRKCERCRPVRSRQRLHHLIDGVGGQSVRFAGQVGVERGGLG